MRAKCSPACRASSYFAMGAGSSFTWIDPDRQIVVVVRWLNPVHADEFFGRVTRAVESLA